jgi:hypothetical protein
MASISATSTLEGQFPIVSNNIHTTAYTSETLAFTPLSASVNNTYYVGDTNKELAKFKLGANSSNNRDITLKNIRLKVATTSSLPDTRIDNLKLLVNGTNIATSATIDGRYINFTTNGYVIPYGTDRTFYVYGDIVGVVSNGDTIRFYLDKNSDITGLENGTNASVAVSGQ